MNSLKIHDIKPLVEIPDYSLYIFIALILLLLTIFAVLAYYIYKIIRNKEVSAQKKSFEALKNLDFSDAKRTAYVLTLHGRIIASTPREKKLLEELITDIEKYKYKKVAPAITEETKHQIEIFMDAVDVK